MTLLLQAVFNHTGRNNVAESHFPLQGEFESTLVFTISNGFCFQYLKHVKLYVSRNRNKRHSVRINRVLLFESSKCNAISVTLSHPSSVVQKLKQVNFAQISIFSKTKYRIYSNKRPTSNQRPPRISPHLKGRKSYYQQ